MAALKTLDERVSAALEALGRGGEAAGVARAANLDRRAVLAVTGGKPADARGALTELSSLGAEARAYERTLSGSVTWPAVTLATVALATGVVASVALPALRRLPLGGSTVSPLPLAVAFGLAVVLLAMVVVAARQRLAVAGALTAWRSLDAWAFLSCARALHAGGASLPTTLRASAAFCAPTLRPCVEALARELEAGQPSPGTAAPLLGAVPAGLLVSAAKAGTVVTALEALTACADAQVRREVPRDAARIQLAAQVLAGAALTSLALAFFVSYLHAVIG